MISQETSFFLMLLIFKHSQKTLKTALTKKENQSRT